MRSLSGGQAGAKQGACLVDKQELSKELVHAKEQYSLGKTPPLGHLHKDPPRVQKD